MLSLLLSTAAAAALAPRAARFGIITDVHYADYDTAGTRFYRDSLPKVCTLVSSPLRELLVSFY